MNQILIRPHITEKSAYQGDANKYTFIVHPDANKIQISEAVSGFYNVKVKDVNVMRTTKKTRLIGRGRTMTKRPRYKKAVVTLHKGEKIDVTQVKEKKK